MIGSSDSLEPFHAAHAREVAGWAATAGEARRWGGQAVVWPVAASVFSVWHADPDVRPSSSSAAYCSATARSGSTRKSARSFARIIVRPERRGQGLERLLVTLLLEQAAQTDYRAAFVRVAPDSAAALACYRRAGFVPVGEEERLASNEGQPLDYVWLRRELGPAHAAMKLESSSGRVMSDGGWLRSSPVDSSSRSLNHMSNASLDRENVSSACAKSGVSM